MTIDKLLAEAIQLRQDKHYPEAEAIMAELHADYPNNARINYHFAWLCDVQGKEKEAVPYYETAIKNGLEGGDLRGALLGLGSTYRTLGEYEKSVARLKQGTTLFPEANEFKVFLAMALYNVGDSKEAVGSLLKLLLHVSEDSSIQRFKNPIALYAEDLDRTWD
ncbi:MAG: tetratricopeptide repeat protein [Phototrophicaceae bacterium]